MKKHLLHYSRLWLFAAIFCYSNHSFSQLLMVEDFEFTGNISDNINWEAFSSAGTQPSEITMPGLIYPTYPGSGVGNAALIDDNGEDVQRVFGSVTSGTVYASFMFQVYGFTSQGYFFHFRHDVNNSSHRARVFVESLEQGFGDFQLGFSKGGSSPDQTIDNLFENTTYVVIVKYEFVPGDSNDEVSLFLFDGGAIPATEPAIPSIGPFSSGTDITNDALEAVALRQYNNGQDIIVDAIRVGTGWTTIIPSTVVANCQNITRSLDGNGKITVNANEVDAGSTGTNLTFTIDGQASIDYNCNDISTHTVTLRATEGGGAFDECSANITILDTLDPEAKCKDAVVGLDCSATAQITTTDINNNSIDNCGIQSLDLDKTSFGLGDLGDNTVTLTVTDNSNRTSTCTATVSVNSGIYPSISITDVTKAEGSNSGASNIFIFEVMRTTPGCGVSLDYSTSDGSATTTDNDFVARTGAVTFTPTGADHKFIAIEVKEDLKVEPNEIFYVNLQNITGALVTDNQGKGTIINDDLANLNIDDVSVDENANTATFTVTLNAELSNGLSIDYSTADDTAQDENGNNDYTSLNGTLNFAGNAGEAQTISIAINDDDKVELDEAFKINLSNLQAGGLNISIADGEGIGTIQNDDLATLSIDDVSHVEGLNGTTDYLFTVSLSGNVDASFITNWETQNNTATIANNDYISNNGSLNFAGSEGESHTLMVQSKGDCIFETDEDFLVQLLNIQANGRNINFAKASGIATILNDDANLTFGTCPASLSVVADANCSFEIPDYSGTISATSTCGNISYNQTPPAGTLIGLGTTPVTLTATDAVGNSASCTFNIQVEDNSPPTPNCQNINTYVSWQNIAYINPTMVGFGSSDNCTTVDLVSVSPNSFDCGDIGPNTVMLTIEDGNGIQATCTSTVTVIGIGTTCYLDADGDSFGDADFPQLFCFACGTGYVNNNEDCDDTNPNIRPNVEEICDGIDNNCDGNIDELFDFDGDGVTSCAGDCDDFEPNNFPGNVEVCDGIDNNCDGIIDEGCDPDNDMDGFTVAEGDCNDNDLSIFPGATEICDNIDNNCDGQIDEGFDLDGDGVTTCAGDCDDNDANNFPLNMEVCDGFDNNCDGYVDEGLLGHSYVGDFIIMDQEDLDNFPSCIAVLDGDLVINGSSINDLSALSSLTEITGNLLINMTGLSSLNGLENLVLLGGNLNILVNSSLTNCCAIESLINTGVGGMIFIFGNATGCETQPAIVSNCNASPLVFNPGNEPLAAQFNNNSVSVQQADFAKVFPNPTENILNVQLKRKFNRGTIELFNLQGQMLMRQIIKNGQIDHELELGMLPGGVYLLSLKVDGEIQTEKITIK